MAMDPYPKNVAASICSQLATGESLQEILRVPGMPSSSAFYYWVRHHPELARQYAEARQAATLQRFA